MILKHLLEAITKQDFTELLEIQSILIEEFDTKVAFKFEHDNPSIGKLYSFNFPILASNPLGMFTIYILKIFI